MRKGYITVFFTVSIALCMSMILCMFVGIRDNAIRMKSVYTVDTAMTSVFAEYSKAVWDQYGLLFVDMSYMSKSSSLKMTEDHLKACINKNFDECRLGLIAGKDLLKLKCSETEAVGVVLASDRKGKAIKNQAVNLMKYYYKIAYLDEVNDWISTIEKYNLSSGVDYSDAFSAAGELNSKYKLDYSKWLPTVTGGNDISEDTIAPISILRFVTDANNVSKTKINSKKYAAKRKLNKGNLLADYEESITDYFYLREYLDRVCGDFFNNKEGSLLKYQKEYLCSGKSSDSDNLANVVRRILVLRETANMMTLTSDAKRMQMIRAVCEGICALVGFPEAAVILETIVVAFWANYESLHDVKILLQGGKIPLIKTPDQWITGLKTVLFGGQDYKKCKEGLSYSDYIKILMHFTGENKLLTRFMSLIEMDIRNTEGNGNFRIDNCFDEWQVIIYISSDHGYDFSATRRRRMINRH